jgi:Na+/melibiose symporter-like transporter
MIRLNVYQSALCLFIINVNLSFSTVLSQAIFVELGKLKFNGELVGNTKDLVSVYFIVKNVGLILAATLKGVLIEIFSIETVFLINSLNQTIMLIAGIILIEDKVGTEKNEEENTEKLITSSSENNENETKQASSLSILFDYIFQAKILIPYLFVLIFLSTPVYTETMFYYCSNILKLTPNKFGIIQTFQMGANLAIVFIYKNFISKNFSFKQTLTLSRILLFLTLLPNYFLVNGFTQKYINDFYIVLITTSANFILTTVASLPVFNLAAKLSPKNLEGTVYAIFVSAISLGQINSTLFGSWLTKLFNITANNFENMSKLIVATNIIMLIPLPIMYIIPTLYFEPKDVKKENLDQSKEGKELESK